MSLEATLVLSALGLLLAVQIWLWVLLTRRPATDAGASQAFSGVQAALDRQAVQAASFQGDIREGLARQAGDLSHVISVFTREQTEHLNKALQDQNVRLDAQDNSLRHQLKQDAGEICTKLDAQREMLTVEATKLRRDMTLGIGELNRAVEAIKTALAEGQTVLGQASAAELGKLRDLVDQKSNETRALIDLKLKEMRDSNDLKLTEMQRTVNEHLQSAVEKQMNESFNRVIDQFAAVQKAMGDVQAVTAQIGDIKRLFSNVKTRGVWAETQVKALLDDILPPGGYETNKRLRDDTDDVVEFAVVMPLQGGERVYLAVDAKFPMEDYDRLSTAWEAGDAAAESRARTGLQSRIRIEAAKIATKYINPPHTVEFAILYLPTEGLYAEVARVDGLIEELGRLHRVLVLGPCLLPAMLRTIQLGHVTLQLSRNADAVRELLGGAKTEMQRMDKVLGDLARQVGTVGNTISKAQVRTSAMARKLKNVEALDIDRVEQLLQIESDDVDEFEEEIAAV